MNKNTQFFSRDRGNGNGLCLLLFFLAGSLLAKYEPGLADRFAAAPLLLPGLLLLPSVLGGCVFGGVMIPLVTLLYGVMAMRAFSGFGYPELRLPEIWAHVVLPLCVSAPFLFLSCEAGMLLADASLSVMTSGNAADRSMVLKRQALHLSGAIGTLLFWYWLR